jgi:membrane protein involved in colicin uptake
MLPDERARVISMLPAEVPLDLLPNEGDPHRKAERLAVELAGQLADAQRLREDAEQRREDEQRRREDEQRRREDEQRRREDAERALAEIERLRKGATGPRG